MKRILAFLGFLFLASQVFAEPRISEIKIDLDGDRVLAGFTLRDAFDQRLSERIESGLPTTIVYSFELHKDRKRWFDHRLKDAALEVTALHDAATRAYTVHYKLDGELIESRTVRDLPALKEAMTQITELPVFTLTGLPNSWRLLLKVQAELGSRTLLSFIPAAITTEWKESRKFHAPRP
ncbi:MAG TPA: DUF4390 domain-containing protein [Thermoanaerobaculia bacterium]|nr:DUF4390 domain-containing protein [Thermoanaerobaculia bacterium]